MSVSQEILYFLNWELISAPNDLIDVTRGDEVIEIYIHDIDGCRPPCQYTLPIVQPGLSFASLRANLLYQKDKCSSTLKNLFVSIRILRGLAHRLIYTNDFVLLAPHYINGNLYRIPIHRVWYCQDYYQMLATQVFS